MSETKKLIESIQTNLKEDEEMNDEDLKMVNRIEEATGYDIEECKRIFENGDYIFFSGVSNDEELGRAYVDIVGISGVNNIQYYIDDTEIKEGIAEYLDDIGETYTDTDLDNMAKEEIKVAIIEENYDYLKRYFDFEQLGRDLGFEDYYFISDGAIGIFA